MFVKMILLQKELSVVLQRDDGECSRKNQNQFSQLQVLIESDTLEKTTLTVQEFR